ncbi:coq2-para-hydroxybenzoate--polyprenyltransferase [Malassezia pachydermatis]|uniref:4-hydroxybenzoate polyprenyltransferase, mitochondrial n=1 Tax=Malassezia pachydermatis TaxID=77020 RepID=A0A0M8MM42_9BASI|nr:coq2-para-hydroxybenzoate--polyprenyltransferase [Malassezia pachydermatis]KOS12887.1 coq2-para-hydroxybenzoate--polyprenyltransferase [Malassezia pachydermatis]
MMLRRTMPNILDMRHPLHHFSLRHATQVNIQPGKSLVTSSSSFLIRQMKRRSYSTNSLENKASKPAKPPFSLRPYMDLMRLSRPIGTYLLFWPCAWSITMASQFTHAHPSVWLTNLALFGVGSLIMRGAGCTINDMWDAKIDAKVDRTKSRPIASGQVSYGQATAFLGLQLAAGLAVLVQLNTYSIILGTLALGPVFAYPLMKRITNLPQIGMGISFTWGSMLGWSAVAGACYWPAVLPLYASTVTWGVAYDTIYAHQDKVDDRATGVGSAALLFGDEGTKPALVALSALWLALIAYSVQTQSPIFPSFTTAEGQTLSLQEWLQLTLTEGHPFFVASWLATAAHIAWQIRTVNLNSRADCWAKFCSNSTVGLIMFLGLAADYLYQWSKQKSETQEVSYK